ncbi:DUF2513 domain-containing protein [Leuconostoc lactis]|uniref:DUF2513 domain-containing protein n=1 Tax=Leuconostoc lactis TaxID=1246 RepID=UPI000E9A54D4|nr:DUF2513 domain-containing protein [Leuconostoc lactis]HBP97350.1 hypothetical protein [Leuconostoc lactis]
MKLDHDLVRDILLLIEDSQSLTGPSDAELQAVGESRGANREQVGYTLEKLNEAGFILGKPMYASDKIYLLTSGNLTYEGHGYLDNVRDATVWNNTKSKIASTVGNASIEIVAKVAENLIVRSLGLN